LEPILFYERKEEKRQDLKEKKRKEKEIIKEKIKTQA